MLKHLFVFGLFVAVQPAAAQQSNLSFEIASAEDSSRPQDWKLSGGGYEIALDSIATDGKLSLRLVRPRAGGFAGASQTVPTAGLNATRVRLSGYVRTRELNGGAAGLAMLVWGAGPQPIYVESISDTSTGSTHDWTRYELELPLPREAVRIEYGTQFTGAGTAWFDGLSLELVSDTSIGDSVRAYMEHALNLMEKHSLHRDSIDWPSFRAQAWEQVRGARRVSALYPVLESVVTRLGDRHSHFVRPRRAAKAANTAMPKGEMVGDRIGYLLLPEFAGADPARLTAYADVLKDTIRNLDRAGACGWIVDLRNNSGGNMWPMIAGLGPLTGTGTLGSFIRADGTREPWGYKSGASRHKGETRVKVSGDAYKLRKANTPVAVITNRRTASSGEVVAIAFRGRPNTRSFGDRTAGQSTGNEIFTLADGANLVITTTVLADRTGNRYGGPVVPDVALPASNAPATNDAVANAARTWLESLPACK